MSGTGNRSHLDVTPTIFQTPGDEFDEAVLNMLAEMPRWYPAFTGNKVVDSVYTLSFAAIGYWSVLNYFLIFTERAN